jgi:hypothetical protein
MVPSITRSITTQHTMGARLSVSQPDAQAKGQPEGKPLYWYRDNFFLTSDKSYLDPAAVNHVFGSDLMWWNDPMSPDMMNKMLQNCLTVAIYAVPETKEQMQRQTSSHLHNAYHLASLLTFSQATVFLDGPPVPTSSSSASPALSLTTSASRT